MNALPPMALPKGVAINNPGYIPCSLDKPAPAGCVGIDAGLCVFATPEDGIRELATTLMTIQRKWNARTVIDLVEHWPRARKDVIEYALAIGRDFGGVDVEIDLTDPYTLHTMTKAFIRRENGQQPYSPAGQIVTAVAAALGLPPKMVFLAISHAAG